MGMVNGVRHINNLISGAMDSTALQTSLGTAANYGSFSQALSVRSQSSLVLTSATPANAINGSALGRQAVEASEQALSLIAPIGSAARKFFSTLLYKIARTSVTTRTFTSIDAQTFSHNGGIFCGNGAYFTNRNTANNGTVAVSTDGGVSWFSTNPYFTTGYWERISVANGQTYLMGFETTSSYVALARFNGTGTLVGVQTFPSLRPSNVAFGNNVYVFLNGSSTEAWSSATGTGSFTARTGVNLAGPTVCWCQGAGVFTAQGSTTTGATSPDGITWTSRATQPGAYSSYPQIVASPTLFVMGPSSGSPFNTVHTSTDGFTWTSRALPSNSVRGYLHYSQGMFFFTLAPSASLFTYSYDGITWFDVTLPFTNSYSGRAVYNDARGEMMLMTNSGSTGGAGFI